MSTNGLSCRNYEYIGRYGDPLASDDSKRREEATRGSNELLRRLLQYGISHNGCGRLSPDECRDRLRRLPR